MSVNHDGKRFTYKDVPSVWHVPEPPRQTRWDFEGGCWILNEEVLALELYLGFFAFGEDGWDPSLSLYDVDLEQCETSAQVLDWIFQIHRKAWSTPGLIHALLCAIQQEIKPQANLCSFGIERGGGSK